MEWQQVSYKEGIAPRTSGAGRIRREFRRPPSAARPARSAGRGRPLLLLLRRALHERLPDLDRHPAVHPRDRRPAIRSARPKTIFDQNILGGMCARVCPTETLCEEACVRETCRRQAGEDRPAAALRHRRGDGREHGSSTTAPRRPARGSPSSAPARPASPRASAGAAGHDVTIFEARPKAGGLNEYGIAAYKTRRRLRAGRGRLRHLDRRHRDRQRQGARPRHLACRSAQRLSTRCSSAWALPASTRLAPRARTLPASRMRSTTSRTCARRRDLGELPVGRRVVVIGGGMTAIDAAVQSKLLGAEEVTICYRRGQEHMNASGIEQELASVERREHPPLAAAEAGDLPNGGKVERHRVRIHRALRRPAWSAPARRSILRPTRCSRRSARRWSRIRAQRQRRRSSISAARPHQGRCRGTHLAGQGLGRRRLRLGGDDLTVSAVAQGRDAAESIHRPLMA